MSKIKAFLDSPSNRTGLIVWAATVLATVMQAVGTGKISWPVIASGAMVGLLKIFLPDNSVTQSQLMQAGLDVKAAVKNPGSVSVVLQDATGIVTSLETAPPGPAALVKGT
jgi:hypothetical protein